MLQLVLRISAVGAVGLGLVAFGIDRWDWGHFAPGRILGGEKGALDLPFVAHAVSIQA